MIKCMTTDETHVLQKDVTAQTVDQCDVTEAPLKSNSMWSVTTQPSAHQYTVCAPVIKSRFVERWQEAVSGSWPQLLWLHAVCVRRLSSDPKWWHDIKIQTKGPLLGFYFGCPSSSRTDTLCLCVTHTNTQIYPSAYRLTEGELLWLALHSLRNSQRFCQACWSTSSFRAGNTHTHTKISHVTSLLHASTHTEWQQTPGWSQNVSYRCKW